VRYLEEARRLVRERLDGEDGARIQDALKATRSARAELVQ
jgi:hypothetical protein